MNEGITGKIECGFCKNSEGVNFFLVLHGDDGAAYHEGLDIDTRSQRQQNGTSDTTAVRQNESA